MRSSTSPARASGTLASCALAGARLVRQVVGQRVERGTAEVQAGIERALDLDVEPALDRAGDELVGHDVHQHAGHHADQREDGGQLDQQPAAELALPQPPQQPERDPSDDEHQHHRNHHVDAEQARVVALVEGAVVGGLRQQEHQHEADRRDQRRASADGPAEGTRAPRRRRRPRRHRAGRCSLRLLQRQPGALLDGDVPVGLADRADLERPWQAGRYRAGSGRSRDGTASSPISARRRGACARSGARPRARRPGCRSSGSAKRRSLRW